MDESGNVKIGKIQFLYSSAYDSDKVKNFLRWNFLDSKQTKELNLTHNLIAGKAGFKDLMRIYDGDKILEYVKRVKDYIKDKNISLDTKELTFEEIVDELLIGKAPKEQKKVLPTETMNKYIKDYISIYEGARQMSYDEISSIYVNKDQLLDDKKDDIEDKGKVGSKRDDLIKHLFKIQNNLRLYKENQFNEFLLATDFKISSIQTKIELKEKIDALINVGDKTIGQVITEADDSGIVKIDDRLLQFKSKKKYVYDQVLELSFTEFQKLYEYLEGFTPFSTQHKTKGSEFSNVLVILDNGNWNNYNFEYLFTERQDTGSVLQRTRKIFYVCCTRAKENLAVFYEQPSQEVINTAIKWFGKENVVHLDELNYNNDEK